MTLNVRVQLDQVQLSAGTQQNPGIVMRAQPYLWVVFFKIDDADGNGTPSATVYGPPGSHGDLAVGSVRAPAQIAVPVSIGRWDTGLVPLPAGSGTVNSAVKAVAGVVAVLLEEDNVTDDGAEAGRRELVKQVRKAIDGIAADLVTALSFDPNTFAADVETATTAAIADAQNLLQNIWSWLDKDDFIGFMEAHELHDDLSDGQPHRFSQQWPGAWQSWAISGNMRIFTRSALQLSRSRFDFGTVGAGRISKRTCVVTNFTGSSYLLNLATTGSTAFSVNPHQVSVPQSRTATFSVSFVPRRPGASESGTINITRQGTTAVIASIPMTGRTRAGSPQ
jgi:hypothetical protein